MKYARTYKSVMNRVKKELNREIFQNACANKLKFTRAEDRTFSWKDSFHVAVCEMDYLQSGDASKMTFEQWRTKEIYRLGCCKKTISTAVSYEMFRTKCYIEERKEKLTKEQKQVLQNAIDDLRLYLE